MMNMCVFGCGRSVGLVLCRKFHIRSVSIISKYIAVLIQGLKCTIGSDLGFNIVLEERERTYRSGDIACESCCGVCQKMRFPSLWRCVSGDFVRACMLKRLFDAWGYTHV